MVRTRTEKGCKSQSSGGVWKMLCDTSGIWRWFYKDSHWWIMNWRISLHSVMLLNQIIIIPKRPIACFPHLDPKQACFDQCKNQCVPPKICHIVFWWSANWSVIVLTQTHPHSEVHGYLANLFKKKRRTSRQVTVKILTKNCPLHLLISLFPCADGFSSPAANAVSKQGQVLQRRELVCKHSVAS